VYTSPAHGSGLHLYISVLVLLLLESKMRSGHICYYTGGYNITSYSPHVPGKQDAPV